MALNPQELSVRRKKNRDKFRMKAAVGENYRVCMKEAKTRGREQVEPEESETGLSSCL